MPLPLHKIVDQCSSWCFTVSVRILSLAMAVGILFAISDLSLPTFTSNAIDLIAQSSIAVSLFVIGGTVAGTALKTVGKRVISVVIGKLIFLPFAVWIGFGIMDLTGWASMSQTCARLRSLWLQRQLCQFTQSWHSSMVKRSMLQQRCL